MTTYEAVKRAAKSEFNVVKWPVILALVFFALSSSGVLSHAEGRMFPVVAGTDVTRATASSKIDGQTLFYGHAKKLRNCSFERVEWYLTEGGMSSRIDITFYETGKVRRPGEFSFGPWGIMTTRKELMENSWALVYHKCHPLFLTVTHFYP